MKSCWVLEVEDENVPGQSHSIAEENCLEVDEALGNDMHKAKDVWQRPVNVPDNVNWQYKEVELNSCPDN